MLGAWYVRAMRIAIDAAGRMVIPKPLRDELGITSATELEVTARDGRLEVAVPELDVTVEVEGGVAVFRTAAPVAPLTVDQVRDVTERTRR